MITGNGSISSGRGIWADFAAKAEAGTPASVRIANAFTLRGSLSDDLREACKEDYPSLYLSELSFDGSSYTISPVHRINGEYTICEIKGYDNPVTAYRYMMHYTGKPRSAAALFTSYDKYVLTNDDTVTWEDLEWGMLSGQTGDYIPHTVVYNEYIFK